MTESYHQPNQQIVPPRFNRLPFCESGADNSNAVDLLRNFKSDEVAYDPAFLFHLSEAYEAEKADPEPDTEQPTETIEAPAETLRETGPGLDLRNPGHLDGMVSHTITHAVAGLLDAGISDTSCIPYWDRQAAIVGMEVQDPSRAEERTELMDGLSINVLRAYCLHTAAKVDEHSLRITLLGSALEKGRRSMRDMSTAHYQRRNLHYAEHGMYKSLFVAKFKHLAWLVDVQTNPVIRQVMLGEISDLAEYATEEMQIPAEDLTIDMGVDAGMSPATDRPLYDISMFKQLAHLHNPNASQQTYSLPQNLCHRLPLSDVLASINRETVSLPFYEWDMRYRLPWRFEE